MNQTFQLFLGPKMLLPAISLVLCYPLCRLGRPDWQHIATKRLALAAYAAIAAYGAIVLTFNYSEFILWHHVTETLYPPLGAAWGLEHVAGGACAWFVFRLFSEAPSIFRDETFFLRGRRLISHQEAREIALRKFKVPANYLWWGMV